ncbi:hypothetical protein DIZ27_12210 [Streptomyces sp. NWU339]|nr:hypothetical protein DIZ27_12210 [Streptomyces sp. NWU339]
MRRVPRRPRRPPGPGRKFFAEGGNLPHTRTSCREKGMISCPRRTSGETALSYLKRAVVTAVATGALAATAVPAWATAEPSATPSVASSPVTSLPPSAAPSAAPTPDASLPPSAAPSAAPTPDASLPPSATSSAAPSPVTSLPPNDTKPIPDVSSAPGATQSSTEPELAHTGSDSTTVAIGAGAAGLVALGAGALFVVRRRALR